MSFKVKKVTYAKKETDSGNVYAAIKSEVQQYLASKRNGHYADLPFRSKAIVISSCALVFYILVLTTTNSSLFVTSYLLFSWFLLLLGFNVAHDASHGCLTGNKRTDQFLFETSFCLLGANPYLWKIRHLYSHHPYPNVEGCDADIELTALLRFSPESKYKPIHRFQHIYAPFLYCIYTLYWIFYKDLILFFRKKQANIHFSTHSRIEWIKLFVYKVIYLLVFAGIPLLLHPGYVKMIVLCFLLSHFINSLFLLFTFLISHHVPQTCMQSPNINETGIQHSWMIQQVNSSADFHAEQKWAYWLFGGFNAHVAHHLFPGICHTHYPVITRIIREHLEKTSIPYHSFTWWQGVHYHLRLLKQMGKEEKPVISTKSVAA